MASRSTIIFNFNQAKSQADKLDSIADRMATIGNSDLDGTMQNIFVNWKGESASLYLRKGNELERDIVSTANALHNIAAQIRAVAERIYRAEMAALEIAERRNY